MKGSQQRCEIPMWTPTLPFLAPKRSPAWPAWGRAWGLLSCWTEWGAIGASWALVDAHIPNTLFVLFVFYPFFLVSFIFLIGLTDHSSFTAVLGWGEECSGCDPWKSIPKEASLQGKINQSLVLVEGGLKTIKNTGLLLQLSQTFC